MVVFIHYCDDLRLLVPAPQAEGEERGHCRQEDDRPAGEEQLGAAA